MTAAMLLPLLLLSVAEGSRRAVRWVLIGVLVLEWLDAQSDDGKLPSSAGLANESPFRLG